ncbi:hypothetical protein NSZ01_23410 [Nocardioides szechwanensis]|uniref:Putative membrane protein n=1 Tax=Nocardioides szechwanensis TaxID=1005944 RepID=A0A1H0IPG2_9ACTN|nr:SHOCT domain-containing protein [Nocardioides szechwanensis]GEP34573.1 hypothetical protein NSZ01_23410 [Nocardioides szechwanensis]SDO33268.1 putative membrane protein [Nocardioides szechwanensis]
MMGGWYHDGGGWGGWLLMMLVMVAFWGLVVAAVVTLFRSSARPGSAGSPPAAHPDPQAILDERLARGDIDLEDYRARRAVLRGSP